MLRTREMHHREVQSWSVRIGAVALVMACAACGGGASSSPARPAERQVLQTRNPQPSASARMVCATEGRTEIAQAVGRDVARPLVGRWRDGVYSCDYVYADGKRIALSVKQLSSSADTTAYFDMLGTRMGRMHALQGLGQGAYQTTNGSTVVRKDNLVLLVDVTHLPATFGTPSSPKADVSLSVAATIMGCWTGA